MAAFGRPCDMAALGGRCCVTGLTAALETVGSRGRQCDMAVLVEPCSIMGLMV